MKTLLNLIGFNQHCSAGSGGPATTICKIGSFHLYAAGSSVDGWAHLWFKNERGRTWDGARVIGYVGCKWKPKFWRGADGKLRFRWSNETPQWLKAWHRRDLERQGAEMASAYEAMMDRDYPGWREAEAAQAEWEQTFIPASASSEQETIPADEKLAQFEEGGAK